MVAATGHNAARIAVVHEWVDAYAGSEQVFEAIARIFPDAALYALSREPGIDLDLAGREVHTTFLDRPGLRERRQLTLPLMPLAWHRLGRGDYDLVISSHHAFAHTNRLAGRGAQLVYVHSPARYLWSPDIDARGSSALLAPARYALRRVDARAARKVTSYAANSRAVADRIAQCWHRESVVIHPPVRVEYFAEPGPAVRDRGYLLGVGRWIPYKNLHVVIEVADALGVPVKIAGRGPDKSRIEAAAENASVPVELIESPSDRELRELYRNAMCLMFPTVEDFGMVPVEANAAGTPVVALGAGGALDTIEDGRSGVLVDNMDVDELARAVKEATSIDPDLCVASSQRFSTARFASEVESWAAEYR
jgi:glycosyltransferase involved in cell wall biosynthesis